MKLLIEKGADVNAGNGWTPLHEAAAEGHLEVVKVLIEKGADVNAEYIGLFGTTFLHWAALEGHLEIVKLLRKYGGEGEFLRKVQGDSLS